MKITQLDIDALFSCFLSHGDDVDWSFKSKHNADLTITQTIEAFGEKITITVPGIIIKV